MPMPYRSRSCGLRATGSTRWARWCQWTRCEEMQRPVGPELQLSVMHSEQCFDQCFGLPRLQSGIRYPVVVRFETQNYAGVNTNNYGLDEVRGPDACCQPMPAAQPNLLQHILPVCSTRHHCVVVCAGEVAVGVLDRGECGTCNPCLNGASCLASIMCSTIASVAELHAFQVHRL